MVHIARIESIRQSFHRERGCRKTDFRILNAPLRAGNHAFSWMDATGALPCAGELEGIVEGIGVSGGNWGQVSLSNKCRSKPFSLAQNLASCLRRLSMRRMPAPTAAAFKPSAAAPSSLNVSPQCRRPNHRTVTVTSFQNYISHLATRMRLTCSASQPAGPTLIVEGDQPRENSVFSVHSCSAFPS